MTQKLMARFLKLIIECDGVVLEIYLEHKLQ